MGHPSVLFFTVKQSIGTGLIISKELFKIQLNPLAV
jgi:predicted NBD/HSP70 family sugar kinase